jgi:hypothetical protein
MHVIETYLLYKQQFSLLAALNSNSNSNTTTINVCTNGRSSDSLLIAIAILAMRVRDPRACRFVAMQAGSRLYPEDVGMQRTAKRDDKAIRCSTRNRTIVQS